MIWRRLLVSSETTIAQLHQYIQVAFNWSGEHWHRFRIHGKDYGIAYLGGISSDDNPHAVRLSGFRLHPRESFRYEYDFIANWICAWKRFFLTIRASCQCAWAEEPPRQVKNMREP